MECNDIQEKLSAYIEGIVSSEERRLIEEHLTSCQKCSESLAELRKTMEHIQNLEDIEPPAWLTQKIMTRVRAEAQPKKGIIQKLFYPLHIKLPLEAVAAILIAVTALYIFKTIQPEVKLAKEKIPVIVESKPVPAKPAEQPMLARKPDIMDKAEETPKAPAMVEKQSEIPSGEEMRPSVGTVAKDKSKAEVLSRAPKAKALSERKEEIISLTINVKDIKTASKEIEKALIQLKGEIIKTESFENKDVITAELDSKKFKELIEKLKLIGEVKEKEMALETREVTIEIRIEIVK